MAEDGYITEEEKTAALAEPIQLKKTEDKRKIAPYFTEHVRRYIQTTYGSEVLYSEGLEVHTTLNIDLQRAARDAVALGLRELDKRRGYRGPLKRLPEEEIESFAADLQVDTGEPLEGRIIQAVVTDVNSAEKVVTLRTGPYTGTMALEQMSWARVPNPDVAYNAQAVKDPADVLKRGDVVEVRVLSVTEGVLELALEQEPQVQ